jgi:hypothetical protein
MSKGHATRNSFPFAMRHGRFAQCYYSAMPVNSKSTDRQSVLVSGTHLGSATNFTFSLKFSSDSRVFVILSTLSDDRTGL